MRSRGEIQGCGGAPTLPYININVSKRASLMCARSANMQDDKWQISKTTSNGVATRAHGANILMKKKTFGVTKHVVRLRNTTMLEKQDVCVFQLRRLQSGQFSPMTKSSRISHVFSNYWKFKYKTKSWPENKQSKTRW